jgi:hypothetical protein
VGSGDGEAVGLTVGLAEGSKVGKPRWTATRNFRRLIRSWNKRRSSAWTEAGSPTR